MQFVGPLDDSKETHVVQVIHEPVVLAEAVPTVNLDDWIGGGLIGLGRKPVENRDVLDDRLCPIQHVLREPDDLCSEFQHSN